MWTAFLCLSMCLSIFCFFTQRREERIENQEASHLEQQQERGLKQEVSCWMRHRIRSDRVESRASSCRVPIRIRPIQQRQRPIRWSRLCFLFVVVLCTTATALSTDEQEPLRASSSTQQQHESAFSALTNQPSSSSDSLLIICTLMDGSVVSLDTESGLLTSFFTTGRNLVSTSSSSSSSATSSNNNNNVVVVPDLDGNLYWKQTMQLLPLSIDDVLQAPVQTCLGANHECGIVMGTKLTSLYGMNAKSGKLVWTSHDSATSTPNDSDDDVVVLQREDYIVQHISSSTGHQVWNVTLGRFSALDFGPTSNAEYTPNNKESSSFLLDDDGIDEDAAYDSDDDDSTASDEEMPLVVAFDTLGQRLTVLNRETNDVLWQRQFPQVIARVYGLHSTGSWLPLTVVPEPTTTTVPVPQLLLPAHDDEQQDHDVIYQLLLQQMMQSQRIHGTRERWYNSQNQPQLPLHQRLLASGKEEASTKKRVEEDQPKRHKDTGDSDNVCEKKASEDPPFVRYNHDGGSPMVQEFTFHTPVVPPPSSPDGLFLTWPMVATIIVSLIWIMIALVWIYQNKKKQWIQQASTPVIKLIAAPSVPESPPMLELERNASVPVEPGTTTTRRMSTATTFGGKRSQSLPMFGDEIMESMSNNMSPHSSTNVTRTDSGPGASMHLSMSPTAMTEPPTVTTTTATAIVPKAPQQLSPTLPTIDHHHQAHHLNGIPLVRYSRYRSEFTELCPLGRGGFGSVFECENVLDGRKYAIKKVVIPIALEQQSKDDSKQDQQLQRVLREVKILAVLDHPNIVRYYTAWLELEEAKHSRNKNDMSDSSWMDDQTSSRFLFSNNKKQNNAVSTSSPQQCYSSELFMNNSHYGGDFSEDRPSQMNLNKKKKAKAANPLGWNNFMSDFSSSVGGVGTRRRQTASRGEGSSSLLDYGFHMERSTNNNDYTIATMKDDNASRSNSRKVTFRGNNNNNIVHNSDDSKSWSSSSYGSDDDSRPRCSNNNSQSSAHQDTRSSKNKKEEEAGKVLQHLLYIQMQLCTQRTLGDFLANPEARKARDSGDNKIDVPYALFLFHQVAQGVKYVHSRDLIHRDLKPNNCFMDDSGVVKVGDFGLSRESSSNGNEMLDVSLNKGDGDDDDDDDVAAADNTAGVGTRSYASPEQINGSDYDSSTDIYSLGIILFELCYPMYTGMERHLVFTNLRHLKFPKDYNMAHTFPDLHNMLHRMLSAVPSERPTADQIVRQMDKILGEFMVLSIDETSITNNNNSGATTFLLRVETEPSDGILTRTIQLIKNAATTGVVVTIDQYGLRSGGEGSHIIEFALSIDTTSSSVVDASDEPLPSNDGILTIILERMNNCPEIKVARQVSSKMTRERSVSVSAESVE